MSFREATSPRNSPAVHETPDFSKHSKRPKISGWSSRRNPDFGETWREHNFAAALRAVKVKDERGLDKQKSCFDLNDQDADI